MLINKFAKILLSAVCLAVLSACANVQTQDDDGVARAIADGYLMLIPEEAAQSDFATAQAEYRSIGSTQGQHVPLSFLRFRHLYFSTPNRELAAIHTERGARVQEGDVLADLVPLNREEAERMFIRKDNIVIELERFDRDFELERDRRLVQLEQERDALEFADDGEWHRLTLELERREIGFDQWLINQEQARERIADRLETILDQIAGDQIIAPMDGIVSFVGAFLPGALLQGLPRMFTLVDVPIFLTSIPANMLLPGGIQSIAFRYGEILPMTMAITAHHREYFYVQVVSDPRATGARGSMRYMLAPLDWQEFYALLERYEIDLTAPSVPVFSVQQATQLENVLTVPTRAIRHYSSLRTVTIDGVSQTQTVYHHYVHIYENGARRRQYIVTGMVCTNTRRQYTEVLFGLSAGQRVVLW